MNIQKQIEIGVLDGGTIQPQRLVEDEINQEFIKEENIFISIFASVVYSLSSIFLYNA